MSVEHYENFPVASVLCPPRIRPAVVAIYHFARTADDIADEGQDSPVERREALRRYRTHLAALYDGTAKPAASGAPSDPPQWQAIFDALGRAVREHALPHAPLAALLEAFNHDAGNPLHPDRQSLLWYCERSANPIGRLLLHLYGVDDTQSLAQSDAICTALQLINFWQDLSVDLSRGRLYLCASDLAAHGLSAQEMLAGPPAETHERLAQLVGELNAWAVELMQRGAPLALRLPGRIGWELRLVVQGGLRVAEKIARMQHRSFLQRPRLSAAELPLLLWRALRMRRAATA